MVGATSLVAAQQPQGPAGGLADGFYKPEAGPLPVASADTVVLHDGKRGKDLQVRATWPDADGPFPVVVWCHGATGTKDMYQPLVRHWAGHGYVCLQANHSDSRALTGREGPGPRALLDWESRPKDVAFILDALDTLQEKVPALKGKPDRRRIGVGGHSFGAHTAQLVAGATTVDLAGRRNPHADERPAAFLLLSPQGVGSHAAGLDKESWDGVTRPFIVITGTNDFGRKGDDWRWRLDPYTYAPPKDKFLLVIEGAWHGFGGVVGGADFRGAGPENAAHRAYVQSASVAFWDAFLKGDAKAAAFLRSDAMAKASNGKATLSHKDEAGAQAPAGRTSRADAAYAAAVEDATWRDGTRGRDVPLRIYAPDRKHGDGPFPVIVFSHGGGESREAFGYLGTHWAKNGYVAVFLTHPGSDRKAIDQQGLRGMGSVKDFHLRPEDVRFVLDELLSDNPGSQLVKGRLAADQVAVAGQCAGATTALAMVGLRADLPEKKDATFIDPRFTCAVALSPQPGGRRGGPLHEDSWRHIAAPTLMVTGTRDFNWLPESRANPRLARMPFDGLPPGDKHLVEIKDAEHNAFTDSVPYYPARERDLRHHGWIQRATTAFLDAYLKGDAKAREWLQSETLERETQGECLQEQKPAPDSAEPAAAAGVGVADGVRLHDAKRGKDVQVRVTWPEAGGPCPVIVFSHRVGGARHDYRPLVEHWAKGGYVVVQADHADSRELPSSGPRLDWADRARDLSFVVDSLAQIAKKAPGAAERMDARRIGAAGHLIGAYAACVLVGQKNLGPGTPQGLKDDRVHAALLLSPQGRGQGLTEDSWRDVTRPLMVLSGSDIPSRRTGNPAEWRREPYTFSPPGDKYLAWIEGLDGTYAGLVQPDRGDDAQAANWIKDTTLAFWDAHLKGDAAARGRLCAWPISDADRQRFRLESKAVPTPNQSSDPAKASDKAGKVHGDRAADYSAENGGCAVLVMVAGKIVFERYDNGFDADTATHLYSATKGFWGPVIAAMIEDGLIESYDELASKTLPEWKDDPRKSRITLRHLLSLNAGLIQDVVNLQGHDRPTLAPDLYRHAVGVPAAREPGEVFQYGPSCYYVLGEIMKRKLAARKQTPLEYLKQRILDPIGVKTGDWVHDKSGNPHIPNGAHLTAREWAKYGQWLLQGGQWDDKQIVRKGLLEELVRPSQANPGHGLALWLNRPAGQGSHPSHVAPPAAQGGWIYHDGCPDLYAALGAGKCRMYVIPSLNMVALRQADSQGDRCEDHTFLSLLLTGEKPRADAAPRGEALILRQLDRDGNGKISPDEAGPQLRRWFDRLDTDHDSALSPSELQPILQRRRPLPERGGSPGGK